MGCISPNEPQLNVVEPSGVRREVEPNGGWSRNSRTPRASPTLERLPGVCDHPRKLMPIQSILECHAPIGENYRHFIVVFPPQFGAAIDVHLTPLEIGLALKLRKCLLNYIADDIRRANTPPPHADGDSKHGCLSGRHGQQERNNRYEPRISTGSHRSL